MNKTPADAKTFFVELLPKMSAGLGPEIWIFPPALICQTVQEMTRDTAIRWGGQNCYFENQGAFTGECSPATLKAMGAYSVLVGHSERRSIFGETNGLLAKKLRAAQRAGLTPLLCIGETLAERESGDTSQVLKSQTRECLKFAGTEPLALAYEPVWAIGTGRVATEEQVAQAHRLIRETLTEVMSDRAAQIPILYGGSVKADNALNLSRVLNLDGFLVGGASLQAESFLQICTASSH